MMREERARVAAAIYADRRDRDALFGQLCDGLGEPAWDMLLLLYVRDSAGETTTAGQLVDAPNVRFELSWPYLGWLKSQGLLDLEGLGQERGAVVTLSDRGRELMDTYLERRATDVGRAH